VRSRCAPATSRRRTTRRGAQVLGDLPRATTARSRRRVARRPASTSPAVGAAAARSASRARAAGAAASCGAAGAGASRRAAGRAQVVEPGDRIVADARGQQSRFPRGRRRLEAFELREHAGERFGAADARGRRDALPVEQEAHEIARLDRLDLAAQATDGVAMDAREQVAFAPFLVVGACAAA
jgi:hypothetical protein